LFQDEGDSFLLLNQARYLALEPSQTLIVTPRNLSVRSHGQQSSNSGQEHRSHIVMTIGDSVPSTLASCPASARSEPLKSRKNCCMAHEPRFNTNNSRVAALLFRSSIAEDVLDLKW
jgi:hypothetical protein